MLKNQGKHNFSFILVVSRMVPGPGKYFKKSKAEAEAELKRIKASNKTSKAMRDNFLMEFEHLSSLTPGPG